MSRELEKIQSREDSLERRFTRAHLKVQHIHRPTLPTVRHSPHILASDKDCMSNDGHCVEVQLTLLAHGVGENTDCNTMH